MAEVAPDLSLVPEPLWQEAERRATVLRPLAALPSCPREQARAAAAALGVTERQVYRLLRRCREGGGALTAMVSSGSDGGRGKRRIEERRDALIRDAVAELYLTPQRLSAEKIVVEVRRRARDQHVCPPSASTVRRRIAALSQEERRRRGDVTVPEAVLGSTVTAKAPLDVVQIDHTPVDLILVDPIERRPIGRPWVTVAIDMFSRCIAGFLVTLEGPSSTSVGLCLAHVASDKRAWLEAIGVDADWPVIGRPRQIGVDNAAEFHSEALERGCAQHDITIDWRPLGRPQVGGVVERVIGTLMELVHGLPGTTFSNVMQRGRYDSDKAACLTLAELERWLAVAIAKLYHLRPHAGLDGAAPLRRYQEGVRALAADGRAPPTPRDPRAFLIDFLPVVRRTLRRDGIVIDHIHYFSDALKPWIERDGPPRRVLIRRDPRDLSRIYVHDPDDGGYLEVGYRELSRPPVSLWEHRLARSRLRRQRQSEVDEGVLFAAIEEMREIEAQARTTTRTTRRNQARRIGLRVITEPDPRLSEPASPWPVLAVDGTASSEPFDVEEW
ncbi:Mu transposase C-terminal domain-containing protein [Sphingomonas sp. Leaf25]|uniref:Mu transposase C-terminal domain-containing protein n=1 Tax=Sphingomonas sp. Leaf25 TaxID=1735692 RepID=UPI0006FD0296|nr:Mu transposase C-terminal domain-containing protein [Sphingomonas sp. Leaf25]KQN05163.1 transposase [Sphingomonas sp. Leaf25]